MKILVYTAITNNRDSDRTDIPVYKDYNQFQNPNLNAKIYKILPHLFFPDYSVYIWVDGNVFLTKNKEYYIGAYLKHYDVATFKHPFRDNIFQEAEELKNIVGFKDIVKTVEDQIVFYKQHKFHSNILYESNMIIRKNTNNVNKMFESWWAQITRWQYRDQISLPFIFNQYPEIKINTIKRSSRNNPDFIYVAH